MHVWEDSRILSIREGGGLFGRSTRAGNYNPSTRQTPTPIDTSRCAQAKKKKKREREREREGQDYGVQGTGEAHQMNANGE